MCTHTHTHTHTHINLPTQILLSNASKRQLLTCIPLNQSKALHRHVSCMHACKHMYIHPAHTHTHQHQSPYIHTKIHEFMVLAEMSTFGLLDGRNVRGRSVLAEMSVAETSVAEISYIHVMSYIVPFFACKMNVISLKYNEIIFINQRIKTCHNAQSCLLKLFCSSLAST